jgi:hypothetical protein
VAAGRRPADEVARRFGADLAGDLAVGGRHQSSARDSAAHRARRRAHSRRTRHASVSDGQRGMRPAAFCTSLTALQPRSCPEGSRGLLRQRSVSRRSVVSPPPHHAGAGAVGFHGAACLPTLEIWQAYAGDVTGPRPRSAATSSPRSGRMPRRRTCGPSWSARRAVNLHGEGSGASARSSADPRGRTVRPRPRCDALARGTSLGSRTGC